MSPDCVVLDLQMPRLSGFDVMAGLERRFPVVVITAHDSSEARGAERSAARARPISASRLNDRELIEAISTAIAHSDRGGFQHLP